MTETETKPRAKRKPANATSTRHRPVVLITGAAGDIGSALVDALSDDFDQGIREALPEKTDPVIVYCQDTACDGSPKPQGAWTNSVTPRCSTIMPGRPT